MATLEQCHRGVAELASRLGSDDNPPRSRLADRTVSCSLTDLDATIQGRLTGGQLTDVVVMSAITGDNRSLRDQAQIRLTMASDDLLELVAGNLDFAHAWATGRVQLSASFRDLLKLRSLLG